MKILRIGIQNLNSLRGEHVIDFTVPPLSHNPLYAIVGATGAGKTTILDAITLALFGITERNRDHTEAKREVATVMTHGTASCRAEVEFSRGGTRYRSVWRRRRAHNKAGKNLLPTERELSRFDPRSGHYEILATKKREVEELTVAVLGLDYDRFVRSVMLTQGAFDRFLKSKTEEKAEILEQITGTEIYRELSEAAYQRAREAREAHREVADLLSHAAPLPPDERSALDEQWTARNTEVKSLKEKLSELQRQLTHFAAFAAAQDQLRRASHLKARALDRWKQLESDRILLADSEALEPLRMDLGDYDKLNDQVGTAAGEIERITREAAEIETRLTQARVDADLSQARLVTFQGGQAERDRILQRAGQLEKELDLLRQDTTRETAARRKQGENFVELESRLATTVTEVDNLVEALGEFTPDTLEEKLAAAENHLPQLEAGLALLRERAQRRKRQERLRELQTDLTERERAVAEARSAAALSRSRVREARTTVDLARSALENARLRASLAAHRRELSPGEACPLCGSTTHPFADEDRQVPDASLERLQHRIVDADNELVAAEQRESTDAALLSKAEGAEQRVRAKLEELSSPEETTEPSSLEELIRLGLEATERLNTERQLLDRLRRLRPKVPLLAIKRAEQQRLSAERTDIRNQLTTTDNRLHGLTEKVAANESSLTSLLGPGLSSQDYRLRQKREEEELRQQLSVREKAVNDLISESTRLHERLSILRSRQEKDQLRRSELHASLEVKLHALGRTLEAANKLLLGPEQLRGLREKVREADQERQTASVLETQRSAEVERLGTAVRHLPEADQVRAAAAALEGEISRQEQDLGRMSLKREQDEVSRARSAELRERLGELVAERDRWARLNELIGSADGKKFRGYAQSITLRRLVDMGNQHLETINPRYRMSYAPPPPGGKEELELEIVDTYMNDNRRLISTLSGGESFLISLALALGLSDLASGQLAIQSLFIDEGFGTLDGKTLDQAMVTLEQLRAQGKTIGIISHVPQLRERIVCQIRVSPQGNGFSRIELAS